MLQLQHLHLQQQNQQYQQSQVEAVEKEIKREKHASVGRKRGVDVKALLGSIDAVSLGERGRIVGSKGRPPY